MAATFFQQLSKISLCRAKKPASFTVLPARLDAYGLGSLPSISGYALMQRQAL
jgi:hypothetical protein